MLFYGILAQILSAQFCLTVFKHTLTFKIPCLLVVHILYLTLSLYEVGRLTSWPAIDSSTFLHLILFKASFWPNQFAWFFPTRFFHIFCPLFIVQHLLWSPTAFSAYNCHPLSKHAYTDAPPPICSYQHLSTISCEPNITISSFVFFLSANLITYIALTILFLVLLKIAIFFLKHHV